MGRSDLERSISRRLGANSPCSDDRCEEGFSHPVATIDRYLRPEPVTRKANACYFGAPFSSWECACRPGPPSRRMAWAGTAMAAPGLSVRFRLGADPPGRTIRGPRNSGVWLIRPRISSTARRSRSHGVRDDLDRQFSGMITTLRALATSEALEQGDFSTFYRQAKRVLSTETPTLSCATSTTASCSTPECRGEPTAPSGDPPPPADHVQAESPGCPTCSWVLFPSLPSTASTCP